MELFPISREKNEVIFQQILQDRTRKLKKAQAPALYLVAGQPGAGKTELINKIKESHQNNVLICNADDLRNYHPDHSEIIRDYELDYPALTWPFATAWNQKLIDHGVSQGYNILIETTLKDLALVRKTLSEKKQQGYITHLYVLAVPKHLSWLGIHIRFESIKDELGIARIVSDRDHVDRFEKFVENLPIVIQSPDLDHIAIFTRKPLIERDEKSPIVQIASTIEAALPAFLEAIQKKMNVDESRAFYDTCSHVLALMRKRSAPVMDIQIFEELAQKMAKQE